MSLLNPGHRLFGRARELQRLRSLQGNDILIQATGLGGGFGLTSLARAFAAEQIGKFPDGFIEVNLGGDPRHPHPVPVVDIQRKIMGLLAPELNCPEDPKSVRQHYRATLSNKQALLLLDDAVSTTQVHQLLPREALSRAIVTSHVDLSAHLPQLPLCRVGGLEPSMARQLLGHLSPSTASLRSRTLSKLVTILEGNPLALRLLAPVLERMDARALRRVHRELAQAKRVAAALLDPKSPVAAVDIALELTYRHLDDEDLKALEALAVMPAPFNGGLAAAVWDLPQERAVSRLHHLVQAGFIEHYPESALYELHSAVQHFAETLLLGQGDFAREVTTRYVIYVLREAVRDIAILDPRQRISEPVDRYLLWDHLPVAWRRALGDAPGWPTLSGLERWIRDLGVHGYPLLSVLLPPSEQRTWLQAAASAAEALGDMHAREILRQRLG